MDKGSPYSSVGKESVCNAGDPWVREIPWRREWQPTPVFLPGESHEQKSLAGYSPWGHKELDMTERLKRERERWIKINTLLHQSQQ